MENASNVLISNEGICKKGDIKLIDLLNKTRVGKSSESDLQLLEVRKRNEN